MGGSGYRAEVERQIIKAAWPVSGPAWLYVPFLLRLTSKIPKFSPKAVEVKGSFQGAEAFFLSEAQRTEKTNDVGNGHGEVVTRVEKPVFYSRMR